MTPGLLSAFVVLLRPEAVGAEALLTAGLLAAVLAVVVLLRTASSPATVAIVAGSDGFAVLRVRLRASDPSAAGHRRARAPSTTR